MQSEERLPLKFSKLVELVSKKPIPPHVKHLIVEVMVTDEEGEDVEVRLSFPRVFRDRFGLMFSITGPVHRRAALDAKRRNNCSGDAIDPTCTDRTV